MKKGYIEIKNKQQLIDVLTDNIGAENFVIHYKCSFCGDEQVTYEEEITEDLIHSFVWEDCIYTILECTECSYCEKSIYTDYIFGVEFI